MVPAVDRKDTEQFLNGIREKVEATRKEIQSWNLSAEHPTDEGEAQAVRKLAERSAQQARQWTERMLKELDTVYPYPNSQDSSTDIIDKTSVPQVQGLDLPADFPVVRRIKHVRMSLSVINAELNTLLEQCSPGSFFNQCLFRVQEHTIQTGMWLGELLHQFYVAPAKSLSQVKDELIGETGTHERNAYEKQVADKVAAIKGEAVASGESETASAEKPSDAVWTTTAETKSGSAPESEQLSPSFEATSEYPAAEAGVPDLTTEDSKADYTPEAPAKKHGKAARKS